MRRRTRERLVAGAAGFALLVELVLAVWPVPAKYPWGLPVVLVVAGVVAALRLRDADDFSAYLVGLATVAGLAAWTLSAWLRLEAFASLLACGALVALPFWWLVFAVVRSGAADSFDDD